MQEELKNVLTLFREKRKIEIQKTPEVYINQHSSVDEVQEWLGAKGFSDRIRKQLNNLNGSELFKLKKAQLEAYCGKEEGRRLDSQITISRNTTGYKTARSSELRAILAKARAKVESSNFEVKEVTNTSNNKVTNGNKPLPRPQLAPTTPTKPTFKSRYDEDSDETPVISFGLTDESDTDSDDGKGKGTLGKMLKKKRGEILRK